MSVQYGSKKQKHSDSASRKGPVRDRIDERLLRTYLCLGVRDADLSAMLGVSISTVRRQFGATLKKLRAERRTNIRQMIWQKVKDGDRSLLLWLAKTELQVEEDLPVPLARRSRAQFDHQGFLAEFQRIHDIARKVSSEAAEEDGSG